MKKVTDIQEPPFLRVREPSLEFYSATTTWATIDLPKRAHSSMNLIIDIYKKDAPSHPDRHIGWWLWRWEGLQTTLKAGITRDSGGAVSVAIPDLGEFVDCWINEELQEQTDETLLVHCVLRDSKTSAMLFMESLYLFQVPSALQSHLAYLDDTRDLLTEENRAIPFCWSSEKRVALVTDTFDPNSGVGRLLVGLYGILNNNNIACEIYSSTPSPAWRGVVKRTTELFFEKRLENIVLLYNHSIYDVTLPLLQELACPKVLYFHNITPPEHYAAYDAEYARSCKHGLDQLRKLRGFSHFLANSAYSARALAEAFRPESDACNETVLEPQVSVGVAPPMVLPSALCNGTTMPESDLPLPPDAQTLLFVGRIAPHKRIEDLISLFHEYHKLQKDAVLIIAGQEDRGPYAQYLNYQLQKVPDSVRKHIYFYKDIDDAGLARLYHHASAFICMSEHEGFCIPLVEAMSFNLPIFAYAQPAVAETLDGSGVLFHHKDFGAIARAIHRVLEGEKFLEHVLASQRLRLDHLREEATGALIIQTLEEAHRHHASRL